MDRTRVTIRDVAAQAGVSRQTISRVINDSDLVNPETAARVHAVIAELGYRPNAIARSMARGRTQILACISPNLTDHTFASIVQGAEGAVRAQGYFLMSTSAPDVPTFIALVHELTGGAYVDGLVIINPFADDRYCYFPSGIPTVLVGTRPREGVADSVALDDVAAGRMATDHLFSFGHRRIAMITGPAAEDCTQDRSSGYRAGLCAQGIVDEPSLVIEGDWSPLSGYRAMYELLALDIPFSAVFAQNDQMAIGALRAARELGVRVPGDLSVIGVDDIPLAAHVDPPLTTVHQDFTALGAEAARLLFRSMAGNVTVAEHIRWAPELIVRASTQRAEWLA